MYYDYTHNDSGCTGSITLDDTETYEIRGYSQARVTTTSPSDGNYVQLLHPTTGSRYYSIIDAAYQPSLFDPSPITKVMEDSGSKRNNIVAAAGYGINGRYGGLDGELFTFYDDVCPGGNGSCRSGGDAWISGYGMTRKFIVVHETGHLISWELLGDDDENPDFGAANGSTGCDETTTTLHQWTSWEYQTGAVTEGFAHFYAAAVYNDWTESDCEFVYYKDTIDFDPRDGSCDGGNCNNNFHEYSCESGLAFMETECTGTYTARGVEVDWVRFFWDLHTDVNVSFGTIADIWIGADPTTWGSSTVYSRLKAAALAEGVSESSWDYYASANGVDH